VQHSAFSPAQLIEPLSSVDQNNFNKLKAAYDSCIDEDAIKKNGIKPLVKILHYVAASFPVAGSTFPKGTPFNAADAKEIGDTIELLTRLGVSALLSLGALADDKDPDVVVVQAVPPYQIGLPAEDYYEDDSVLQKYEATITQILQDVHPARKDGDPNLYAKWVEFTQIKQYAHELVEFEKKLAKASPDPDARDDVHVSYFLHRKRSVLITSPRNSTILCHSEMLTSSRHKFICLTPSRDSPRRTPKSIG
jgi:endothelin-converting enzyme